MQVFIMHVGHPGNIDIKYTVTRTRTIDEMLKELPSTAPERDYFANDRTLHAAFPDRQFNCWGVPVRAEPTFNRTQIGDLVLIVPWIGLHDGGVRQIGVIRAKCSIRALAASQVLWPDTPHDRLYPLLFFFKSEIGFRFWYDFLADLGYEENWNPRGWYRRIADSRFSKWGGPEGYLSFLRKECGFKPI